MAPVVYDNLAPTHLYEFALEEEGSMISDTGALIAMSGKRTGRSPKDKRVVEEASTKDNVWWGDINMPISTESFQVNRDRAINFLNTQPNVFIVDGYAGWDAEHRISVRVICSRAYHALFMYNMLVRPSKEELATFKPDWTILNAGLAPSTPQLPEVTCETSVNISFDNREQVILGSQYAGEMKKGIFTIMNYLLPAKDILSMHCSCNEGKDGDTALFFGLSGTGKTTLSADPKRYLIGDDEHAWNDNGIFNIEGGCYAKTIDLDPEKEPDIWNAIKFGAILENVVYDPETGKVDYSRTDYTQNTRTSYPVEHISNAKIPCRSESHPKNIVFLTCDAFGVLPPVSKLTPEQAMYHFISGYTAKVAGTEMGIKEPVPDFSSCFGAAFLVWHPMKYAELLRDRINKHDANVWLVNTGWTGGAYGTGSRFSLKYTRAIVDAILDGSLDKASYETDPVFGLAMPTTCENVPTEVLNPRNTWQDKAAYDATAKKLAKMFNENFAKFTDHPAAEEVLKVAPKG
jgi:phosphoenolpyruvate carboxykinase (ATP)